MRTFARTIISFTLLALAAGQGDIGCYVAGQCENSDFNNQDNSATPAECHQTCIDTPECRYFTHIIDGDTTFCFAYTECTTFNPECATDTQTCTSGEVACPVQGDCEFTGRCEGGEVQLIFDVENLLECSQLCSCNDDCLFYTYDSADSTCNLVNECSFIDETCTTCTSGQDGCGSPSVCELTTEDALFNTCSGEYTTVDPRTTLAPGGCNIDFLTVPSGGECYIFSPFWPNPYHNNACKQWNVRSGSDGLINLSFQFFELECSYDHVRVYDGNSPLAPRLADYDGCDTPLPLVATSGNMFIEFTSDSSIVNLGFNATVAS